MNTAYVALGANLGDPKATVLAAFAALAGGLHRLPRAIGVSRAMAMIPVRAPISRP